MIMSGEQWWVTAAFWWPLFSAASGAWPYYHNHPTFFTPPPNQATPPQLWQLPPAHPPLPPPVPQPQAWPVTHSLYINLRPTAAPASHSSNFPLAWCSFPSGECRAKKGGSLLCLRQKQGLRWARVAEVVVVEKTGAPFGSTAKQLVMKLQWDSTCRKTEGRLGQVFSLGEKFGLDLNNKLRQFSLVFGLFCVGDGGWRCARRHERGGAEEEAEGEAEEASGHGRKPTASPFPLPIYPQEPPPQDLHQHCGVEVSFTRWSAS